MLGDFVCRGWTDCDEGGRTGQWGHISGLANFYLTIQYIVKREFVKVNLRVVQTSIKMFFYLDLSAPSSGRWVHSIPQGFTSK
jgi:hypothetical protein